MKLKNLDMRPRYMGNLSRYPNGIELPSKDNIIKVTEGEAKSLMRLKNGNNACYEIYTEKPKVEKIEEVQDNG